MGQKIKWDKKAAHPVAFWLKELYLGKGF